MIGNEHGDAAQVVQSSTYAFKCDEEMVSFEFVEFRRPLGEEALLAELAQLGLRKPTLHEWHKLEEHYWHTRSERSDAPHRLGTLIALVDWRMPLGDGIYTDHAVACYLSGGGYDRHRFSPWKEDYVTTSRVVAIKRSC